MSKKLIYLESLLLFIFGLAGCTAWESLDPARVDPTAITPISSFSTTTPNPKKDPLETAGTIMGLTYVSGDGSRTTTGRGNITTTQPLMIELKREITWLVGVPYQNGSLWTAALSNGELDHFLVREGAVEGIDLGQDTLPVGSPPVLVVKDDQVIFSSPTIPESSPLSHPVSLQSETGRLIFITSSGDLVLWEQGEEITRLAVNALPDARLILDDRGRVVFLSDPTDRYDHGVLGDRLEAASITLVETDPLLTVITKIEIPAPTVIEGIAPIWVDLNGDGSREILVTLSDFREGARLVLFGETGEILAQGPPAGQGYRWRHQLSAAPLGLDGEILIVDVLRPHLDATLEFFRWEGDQLVLLASLPGFSTHGIGSRNLDMTLVGDLDGDEVPEVVVPGDQNQSLNGIGYRLEKAVLLWTIPLEGILTSNLAAVGLEDGSLILGAGVGNRLLIWE